MYTNAQREALLRDIVSFTKQSPAFECLLQIGSGADGFADIYSDIDLMAGCPKENLTQATKELEEFFLSRSAAHVESRRWSDTVLGFSAYFENGLSVDISYMPTPVIPLCSPQYKLLFGNVELCCPDFYHYGLDNSIHYRFINELRYAEIALLRGQTVFADIALGRARQILLTVEAVAEGKKAHQFKAYNDLSTTFLNRLKSTYPARKEDMNNARGALLALYLETVEKCDFLEFNFDLLKLIGCFE